MFIQSIRRSFSVTSRRLFSCQTYTKLTKDVSIPLSEPKSVVVASTPDHIDAAYQRFKQIYDKDQRIQILVATFDTVGVNSMRSGISELWLPTYFQVKDAELATPSLEDSWRHEQGNFEMRILNLGEVKVPLGNTLFHNNSFENMYIYQPSKLAFEEISLRKLKRLAVSFDGLTNLDRISHRSSMTLIEPVDAQELVITDCKHNMVKEINGKPLSSFLQDNPQLMQEISKESKVFARIISARQSSFREYEIVGGGGSWNGVKSKLLLLSPDDVVKEWLETGSKIELYHLHGEHRTRLVEPVVGLEGIAFECSLEEQVGEDLNQYGVEEKCFGIGSEKGFSFNENNFKAYGDSILVQV